MSWENENAAKSLAYSQAGQIGPSVQEDLLSRYKRQLGELERRVDETKKLLALLEENPKTLEILQLMGRV